MLWRNGPFHAFALRYRTCDLSHGVMYYLLVDFLLCTALSIYLFFFSSDMSLYGGHLFLIFHPACFPKASYILDSGFHSWSHVRLYLEDELELPSTAVLSNPINIFERLPNLLTIPVFRLYLLTVTADS